MAELLIAALRRFRRRLLIVRAAEAGLAGAVGAAELAAVVTVIRIILPQHVPTTAAHPALPLVFLPCGFVIAFLVRLMMGLSLREAAIVADHVAGLKERLSTALEVFESAPAGRAGALDERLLAEARQIAANLKPQRLRAPEYLGRREKILAAAILVLAAATLIPSVGGPPVEPQAAERAAETLERIAAEPALAPAVRQQIEKAVASLRRPGVRSDGADQATQAVYQAAAKADRARAETLAALKEVDQPEIQEAVRAAAAGDASAASGAAEKAAARLAATPGAGGIAPPDRKRMADGLAGAAQVARKEDLARLAAELDAAAEAVRRADPATAETLRNLASAMTEALRAPAAATAGGTVTVAEAIAEARRAVGLAELPAASGFAKATPDKSAAGSTGVPPAAQTSVAGSPAPSAEGAAVPPEVRPEDRDVVRRYFGG
jgi:hypothetical protein